MTVCSPVLLRRRLLLLVAVGLVLSWRAPRAMSEAVSAGLAVSPESRLWIEGDSTLHKWRMNAQEFKFEPGEVTTSLADLVTHRGLKALDIEVAVKGLTSGESGLDENARAALKADQFHTILFRLDSYQPTSVDAAHTTLHLQGHLQIAGVTKAIELDAEAVPKGAAMHITGEKQLLLSDYGIKPPTFALGMMSVSDPVTVRFDFLVQPSP